MPSPATSPGCPETVAGYDIAFLADPYTGAEFICDGSSCGGPARPSGRGGRGHESGLPMFSALWAIANQSAGEALGQAAQLLYQLPGSAITDIVPVGSEHNVRGRIHTTAGTTRLSALIWLSRCRTPRISSSTAPFTTARFRRAGSC